VVEAKKGRNVAHYNAAQVAYNHVAPDEPEAQHDDQWVTNMEKQNKVDGARLEAELKGYKNNLIKESIRVGGIGRQPTPSTDIKCRLETRTAANSTRVLGTYKRHMKPTKG
jgi:hypothetical protein